MTLILDHYESADFPNTPFKKFLQENKMYREALKELVKNEREKQLQLTTILGDHSSVVSALVHEVLRLKVVVDDLQKEIQALRNPIHPVSNEEKKVVNSHSNSAPIIISNNNNEVSKEGLKNLSVLNFKKEKSDKSDLEKEHLRTRRP